MLIDSNTIKEELDYLIHNSVGESNLIYREILEKILKAETEITLCPRCGFVFGGKNNDKM